MIYPLEANTSHYSQNLAAYTLRQFCLARSSLDKSHVVAISKIPAAHIHVVRAERLAATTGQTALHYFLNSENIIVIEQVSLSLKPGPDIMLCLQTLHIVSRTRQWGCLLS